ncbi:MAG: UPF0182 family protein [Deltaproteobacteria bacterium]|nr:UPF0182 family protein [Deltaproteobacteria bacterium]
MNRIRFLTGSGLILLLIVWSVVSLYPDWLWFDTLGFSSLFMTMLLSKYGFGVIVWVFLILLITVNIFFARKLNPEYCSGAYLKEKGPEAMPFGLSEKALNSLTLIVVVILSIVVAFKSSKHWDLVLRYFYQVPFGSTEPVFNKDIGFYIFTLPFLILIKNGLIFLIAVSTIITAGWYLKNGALQIDGDMTPMEGAPPSMPSIKITANAKKHLIFIFGIIVLIIGWSFYLKTYELLFSTQGPAFGAGYTDVTIKIWAFRIIQIFSLIYGVLLIYNSFRTNMKVISKAGILWIGAIILLSYVIPASVQKLVVKPNELTKESPYIERNIKSTREAYNLNKIKEVDFNVRDSLTQEDLEKNDVTIQNIRVWDEKPLLQTYRQIQAIRLYYDFNNVDVDRYMIDSKYRQVMISARELIVNQLPAQANTWVNRHLKYTHGYGVVSSPVNEVSKEGLPNLFIKDIPPVSEPDLKIERPEIYYGEKTDDYVLVKTKTEEFDYAKGDNNVYTNYQGKGGVVIGSFIRKLLYAIEFMDPQILFTNYLTAESRIMYNRNIQNRLNIIAPFLTYDNDPYIVISEGRLYWIMDAYTTSDMYPYSSRSLMSGSRKEVNYIRNSVKVIIDTYNGSVDFYTLDEVDPILKTYKSMFPEFFKPISVMPEDLKKHLRYPRGLFSIQVDAYLKYHMEDIQVFYNQEDLWQVPDVLNGDTRLAMEPYYIIIKLPDEEQEEFFLMLPMTPSRKDNMIGWLAARCDHSDYGSLIVYKLPKDKLVYGPMQIEARVNQQTEISREFSLWDQRGSSVIRGNILAIPVEDTFIYVEPVYLEAKQETSEKPAQGQQTQRSPFSKPQSGASGRNISGTGKPNRSSASLPELKRIIAASGNRVVMHERLEGALRAILGSDISSEKSSTPESIQPQTESSKGLSEIAKKALEHYRKAKEYLREDNWAGYGKELDELEKILTDLGKKEASEKE